MFASDALWFSSVFFIGIALLSTFFKEIGEFLFSVLLPKRDNSLETRLMKTNIFFWKHWPFTKYLQTDYIRSLTYDEDPEDIAEMLERQEQVKWVEVLKSRFGNRSNPLTNMDSGDEKKMDDLVDEEEMVLHALLESLEQRRLTMHDRRMEEQPMRSSDSKLDDGSGITTL